MTSTARASISELISPLLNFHNHKKKETKSGALTQHLHKKPYGSFEDKIENMQNCSGFRVYFIAVVVAAAANIFPTVILFDNGVAGARLWI